MTRMNVGKVRSGFEFLQWRFAQRIMPTMKPTVPDTTQQAQSNGVRMKT